MPRVLVADEDLDTREILASLLREEGYEVVVADSAATALLALDEARFDAALIDSMQSLPDNPFGAAEQIAQAALPTPVLLHTAWSAPFARNPAAAGFAGVLFKPAQTTDLLLSISSAVGNALPRTSAAEVETAHAWFERLTARDWDGLAALCSEEVVYLLPGESKLSATVEGRKKLRDFAEQTFAHFPSARFTEVAVYRTPEGLAASYLGSWQDGGARHEQPGRVIFRFDAQGLVCRAQVGINTERVIRKNPKLSGTASDP
jgi:CheY-like chemotaxis protein/ketosteroid isomerase-like protein